MVISETRSRLQSLVYVGVSLSQPRGGMNITVAALANKVRWLDASPRLFSYIEKNIQLMMILEGMGIDAANQMTAKAFNDHFLQIIDILVVSIRILEHYTIYAKLALRKQYYTSYFSSCPRQRNASFDRQPYVTTKTHDIFTACRQIKERRATTSCLSRVSRPSTSTPWAPYKRRS